MEKSEIIKKLEEIVKVPGFIHTLTALLVKDMFFDPEEVADKDWSKHLSIQEFTFLIGLMVKNPISLELPSIDKQVSDFEEVPKLFEQLHQAHTASFWEKMKEKMLGTDPSQQTTEEKEKEYRELFGSGEMVVEPIFYGGSGAYDFQYTELAKKKYSKDAAWILNNRGFSIETAVGIAEKLKERTTNVMRSCKRPEDYEEFCKQHFRIFTFSKSDLEEFNKEEVENFLKAFSLTPGEVNKDLESVGQYNTLSSHPIIKLEEDLYILPISFLLTESIYESPFYWMSQDSTYKDTANKNRGESTEDIAYEMLLPVFNGGLFKNIKVQRSRTERATDIDILAVSGNKAIVFQAKSKRLTETSRKGDTEQLKKDFSVAVQKAYDQGLVCRDAILSRQSKLLDSNDNEIKLDESIDEVYIVCLTSDHYPALASQMDVYLTKTADNPLPVGMSILDLEIVAFYLKDPFEFLYYLRQRINLGDYFRGDCEVGYLAYHLNQKLFRIPKSDKVALDSSWAQLIDANYPVLRGAYPATEAVERLHHKWKNNKFQRLIDQIKSSGDPGFTDAIFYCYDLSGDSADDLIKNMELSLRKSEADGKNHDFAMVFENGKSGVTFVAQNGSPEKLEDKLMGLAMARKYKTKADTWLALGSLVGDPNVISAVAFTKQPWEHDETLEEFHKVYLKKGTPMHRDGTKIGRNERCPCGSGKKFKKCCGV